MNQIKIIILIILLVIILVFLYYNNNYYIKENFKKYRNTQFNKELSDINEENNSELEVKKLSNNIKYNKLNKYLIKNNLIYNIENLDTNLPLVITYDNQSVNNYKNESFINFLKGLNYYNYNYIVCGINRKWDSWYGRYKTYLELLNNIPDEQLIFITDSRDVLVNNSSEDFIKNYNKIIKIYNDEEKNKIIFGTEIGCCVNQLWHYSPGTVFSNIRKENNINIEDNTSIENNNLLNLIKNTNKIKLEQNKSEYSLYPTYGLIRDYINIYSNEKKFPWEHWINWNNLFKEKFVEANLKYNLGINDVNYPITKLNFGMIVGINKNVIKMFNTFDLRPGEDDQHMASEFFFMRPEIIILDYTQILLSNTGYKHSFRKCTSKTMNNTNYNFLFNDHLNDHKEYVETNVYTREEFPEQGIMYGFDIELLKYFFTYDNIISFPCFIQSPGKDWNCYNELLYRLPYCDDKMCSFYYNLEETQKYNVRDIIIHEYKNQSGDMKIKWILSNILNPLYWALNLFIVKDIYEIINKNIDESFILLDFNNLLSYYRFKNLETHHITPWDYHFDLGWYSKNKFSIKNFEDFFKNIAQKGYEIVIYYKQTYVDYSVKIKDHFVIKINSKNIIQISNILSGYEIVLFNIVIPTNKYIEILKKFNMNINYEDKNLLGSIKIPSIDIILYEYNNVNLSYENNKLLKLGNNVSIPKKYIEPISEGLFNMIKIKLPNDIENIIKNKNFNIDIINITRYSINIKKKRELNEFNKLNLTVTDENVILITKIYNNFINKYFEIINSNDNIKKIIYS